MKKVYWRILSRGTGFYIIEFWTKKDESNKISVKMVTLEIHKLVKRIEQVTGLSKMTLVQVDRPKKLPTDYHNI